jgi:hypothetical protein
VLRYWLAEELPAGEEIELVITDSSGNTIRRFKRKPEKDDESAEPQMGDDDRQLSANAGLNHFEWNLRFPSVEQFPQLVLWNKSLEGPLAVPGTYQARLIAGDKVDEVEFEIMPDPRPGTSAAELEEQFEFVWGINQKLTETHRAINRLRAARAQISGMGERVKDDPQYADVYEMAGELQEGLTGVEETLYQVKMESPQDPLNFPIRLNDKLAGVMSLAAFGNHAPTASTIEVRDELVTAIDTELAKLDRLLGADLVSFNELIAEHQLPAVVVE